MFRSLKPAVLCLGLALTSGCGTEDFDDAAGDIALEEAPEAQQGQQSRYDSPVVGGAYIGTPSISTQFIYAINTSNLLMMKRIDIADESPATRPWVIEDSGLKATPTAVNYSDLFGSTLHNDVFAVSTGNNLYEYYFDDPNGAPDKYNISSISGFGKVKGNPTIVDYYSVDLSVSVAVIRESDNKLYTLDWTPDTDWMVHPVLNGSSTVVTTNNVFGVNSRLTGRGLTSSDDTTGWIAIRSQHAFDRSFVIKSKFDNVEGTPWFKINLSPGNGTIFARRFDSTGSYLEYAGLNSDASISQWNVLVGLTPGGSPLGGYIRGSNGHLFSFSTSSFGDLGEGMTSAPKKEYCGTVFDPCYVFFRGNSGTLYARDVHSDGDHWNMNLDLP